MPLVDQCWLDMKLMPRMYAHVVSLILNICHKNVYVNAELCVYVNVALSVAGTYPAPSFYQKAGPHTRVTIF